MQILVVGAGVIGLAVARAAAHDNDVDPDVRAAAPEVRIAAE